MRILQITLRYQSTPFTCIEGGLTEWVKHIYWDFVVGPAFFFFFFTILPCYVKSSWRASPPRTVPRKSAADLLRRSRYYRSGDKNKVNNRALVPCNLLVLSVLFLHEVEILIFFIFYHYVTFWKGDLVAHRLGIILCSEHSEQLLLLIHLSNKRHVKTRPDQTQPDLT